jgi:acetyltransferase-like isoleucine patch superfamily enzyme
MGVSAFRNIRHFGARLGDGTYRTNRTYGSAPWRLTSPRGSDAAPASKRPHTPPGSWILAPSFFVVLGIKNYGCPGTSTCYDSESDPEGSQMDTKKPFLNKRVYIRGPEWDAVANAVRRAIRLTAELNKLSFDDDAKVRELFGELIGQKVDETFKLIPPFYTEGGLNIRVGHKVFINQCCTIYDMGGVDIGDLVMIGPNVNIITAAHPVEPSKRRAYIEAKPIVIEKNVWIATAVTIPNQPLSKIRNRLRGESAPHAGTGI